jgi:hypothetical protein
MVSVGYEYETRVLEIEFSSHDIYQYFHVPVDVYTGLLNSESNGKYFNEHIKDKYEFEKIEKPPPPLTSQFELPEM